MQPRDVAKYSLLLLLLHVKNATSWDSLKTYNGTLYPTFREAALARGLLRDDREWDNYLTEVAQLSISASRLRELFATLIGVCQVTSPGLMGSIGTHESPSERELQLS